MPLAIGNFSLPAYINKKFATHKFIKDFEHYNRCLNEKMKLKFRNSAISKLFDFLHKKVERKNFEIELFHMYRITCQFCQELIERIFTIPEIIFTNADKGNVMVTLNRDSYVEKIEEMLQDQ